MISNKKLQQAFDEIDPLETSRSLKSAKKGIEKTQTKKTSNQEIEFDDIKLEEKVYGCSVDEIEFDPADDPEE